MILESKELDDFVVEPWMELEPFDPKLIKKLDLDHPYKILLRFLLNYSPSYRIKKNDANPDYDGYEDFTDYYFEILDDYNRYGIAFDRYSDILPDNKLGVFEYEYFGKTCYYLVKNRRDKKILLFNKVKTINLDDHDRGEKPLSEEEKQKRDLIKKQTNKKLQVALMDPDIYNNDILFKKAIEISCKHELLIEKFNHRMTYHGFYDFLRIQFN